MADKTEEGNFLHIPRDAVERKRYHAGPPVARDRSLAKQDETDDLALKGSLASPLADKTEQGNFLHLPRDAGDRKHYARSTYDAEGRKPRRGDEEGNRFEIMNANSLKNDFAARVKKATRAANGGAGGDSTTAGEPPSGPQNYMQDYMEEVAFSSGNKGDVLRKMAEQKAQERNEEACRIMEKRREDEQRGRAKQLQSDLAWWKDQSGSGTREESAITSAVDSLTRELNAIPEHLKK